ncbi:hypothetical protein EJ110_NYTH02888 [Nymphaea thermarum]|nr:hypothetical protein EJ110_NYTH02888 [Nymphaea thermarum]
MIRCVFTFQVNFFSLTMFFPLIAADGGKNPTFQEKFVFTLIEGRLEINVNVWNSNTFSVDDHIVSGKSSVKDKMIHPGLSSAKEEGEVKLIMHYKNLTKHPNTRAMPFSSYPPPSGPPQSYPAAYAQPPPCAYPSLSCCPYHTPPMPPYHPPPVPMSSYPPAPYPPQPVVYPPPPYPPTTYPPATYPPAPYPGTSLNCVLQEYGS